MNLIKKISVIGINLIKSFEGCRLDAYQDASPMHIWTIGWGHTGKVDGKPICAGMKITKQKADEILVQDLDKFAIGVASAIKVDITQKQFDALVSFAYNCGLGSLQGSTLLKLVNQKKFDQAANEFAKWNKSGDKVLAGLTRRRAAERALFIDR